MSVDFIVGFILGAGITALGFKGKLDGFKDLFVELWKRIKGKKGGES